MIACDNQAIIDTGLVRFGEQICAIRLLDGSFKGQVTSGVNMLNGSLEQDKVFQEGDTALVLVNQKDGKILSVSMIDHYRLGGELLLAGLFTVLLLAFAGRTGLRAVLSFVLTVLMIWKILIPFYLRGANPVWIGLGVTLLMTVLIIAPVYGIQPTGVLRHCGSEIGNRGYLCAGYFIHRPVLHSRRGDELFRKSFIQWLSGSESDVDFYGQYFHWRFRCGDGFGGGHHFGGQ